MRSGPKFTSPRSSSPRRRPRSSRAWSSRSSPGSTVRGRVASASRTTCSWAPTAPSSCQACRWSWGRRDRRRGHGEGEQMRSTQGNPMRAAVHRARGLCPRGVVVARRLRRRRRERCGGRGRRGCRGQEVTKIAFFGFAKANSFAQATWAGVQEQAQKEGVEPEQFDPNFDSAKQVSQIQNAITSGEFQAFIVQANDGNAVFRPIRERSRKTSPSSPSSRLSAPATTRSSRRSTACNSSARRPRRTALRSAKPAWRLRGHRPLPGGLPGGLQVASAR